MNFIRYRQHVPQWASRHPGEHAARRGSDRTHGHAEAATVDTTANAQWMPRVDIKEEAARFVILADLPGVDPQEIEIRMDKGILTIQGARKVDETVDGEHFSRVERRHGAFARNFALPDSADADGISATGRNGVLEVVIPKKPESAPRRIQVGTASTAGTTAH